jgi:2-methylisocitrate lyase-like PEP mutase family enzyme
MQSKHFETFAALHHQATPLLLPNAWDAASAVLLQADGAQAIATSSSAMAWSLGYADGSALPKVELLAAVRRMLRVSRVPISVDMEDGYSADPSEVGALVHELAQLGVAGINIEDGAGTPELLVEKIKAIRAALGAMPLYINARTDVLLKALATGDAAIDMCIARQQSYAAAGASGAFIPGMASAADAARVAPHIGIPLNLMVVPTLDPLADLAAAGVKRISAGGALFQTSYGYARSTAAAFMASGAVAGLFEYPLPYVFMNKAVRDAAI